MTGPGYVIVEADKVKVQYPEFQKTLAALEEKMLANTKAVSWPGWTYGGLTPGPKQFGRTTILSELFADEAGRKLDKAHTPDYWGVNNFRQLFTSTSPAAVAIPGWKTILQGAGIATTPEDWRVAWCGLMFADPSHLISKIRFEIDEETHFLLKGFFEATGYQRVIPLGFAYYKRKDLAISE